MYGNFFWRTWTRINMTTEKLKRLSAHLHYLAEVKKYDNQNTEIIPIAQGLKLIVDHYIGYIDSPRMYGRNPAELERAKAITDLFSEL